MIGALALTMLLAASPQGGAAGDGGAIDRAVTQVADRAAALGTPAALVVAVQVGSPETPELGRAVQTALVSTLTARGFKSVLPVPASAGAEGAEAEARAAGADWLLRLTARVDAADLTLAGDAVPTWVNFWAGRDPVRAPGGGAVAVRTLTDAEVLTLAHLPLVRGTPPTAAAGEVATRFALRPLLQVAERVVALAVGDLDGDGAAEIALLTPAQVVVVRGDGREVARRDLSGLPRSPRPPREPAGSLAIGSWGLEPLKPRVAAYSFSRARGEVLELAEGALNPVQNLEAAPLSSGGAGELIGAPVPGRNTYAAAIRTRAGREAVLPFAPVSFASNPRAGEPAWLAIAADGAAVLLAADLRAVERAFPPLGAGAALGDLNGDGRTELALSALTRTGDRLRLFASDDAELAKPLWESEPVAGGFVAGAAGELNMDGRDEAVLAAWTPEGGTQIFVLGADR